MSRTTRWILAAIIAEMTLVAIGWAIWKWQSLAVLGPTDAQDHRRLVAQVITTGLVPLWLALCWWLAERRIASRRLVLSAEHVRLYETGYMVVGLLLAVMQAFTLRNIMLGAPLNRDTILRVVSASVGMLILVQGNFMAKVAPPSGPAAPQPHVWSRMMLRVGWGMALVGLAILVCALTLPTRPLLLSPVVAVAILVANSIWQRRRVGISLRG